MRWWRGDFNVGKVDGGDDENCTCLREGMLMMVFFFFFFFC